MREKLANYLGDRPFWKVTLSLALPIALQNLLTSSFALVDTIMLGSLGDVPLAAVGMAGQLSWIMNMLLFGFSSGATVFFAQYWGSREYTGIHRALGLSFLNIVGAVCLCTLAGLFLPAQFMRLYTGDSEAIGYGVSYLRIACISYLGIGMNILLGCLLRSTECVKLPLYASLASVLANAGLNALLIYGCGLGVRGAAIATAISAWISPVVILLLGPRMSPILKTLHRWEDMFRWPKGFASHYYRISLPVVFNEGIWGLGTALYKLMYSNASTEFYAALTIFLSIEGLTFSFVIGMCNACAAQVGKQIGAGRLEEGYVTGRRFLCLEPLFCAVVGLVLFTMRRVMLLPFSGISQETQDIALGILGFYAAENILRNIPFFSVVGIFRAGGDTRTGVLVDMSCLWVLALPFTYLGCFVFKWPLTFVYPMMLVIEDLPKAVLCLWYFRSRHWIRPVIGTGMGGDTEAAS